MSRAQRIAVFGASGHTGMLVVEALVRDGFSAVAIGRDRAKLESAARLSPATLTTATVDDPRSLDRALDGVAAVVNCAGPFGATAHPLVHAALRRQVPYVDTCADPSLIKEVIERHDAAALMAGVPVVPGVGFFGALPDWLASGLAEGVPAIDLVEVAFALNDWVPTKGSLAAAAAMRSRRWIREGGQTLLREGPPPMGEREFAAPFGRQRVLSEYPGAEVILIPRHLPVKAMRVTMTLPGLRHFMGEGEPDSQPDNSNQRFLVEVTLHRGSESRVVRAFGTEIYGSTAPMVVETIRSVLGNRRRSGVRTPAEIVDWRQALIMLADNGVRLSAD